MEELKLKKLKVAANQFYLNKYMDQPLMSDSEYDSLVKEYESEGGNRMDLVEWESGLMKENEPETPLEKNISYDNNLVDTIKKFYGNTEEYLNDTWYLNLKYDGGGIKLVYDKLGRLQRIQSTPDEEFGIIRTEQFWDIVPHNIDPKLGVKCIRGEVLVDPRIYGKLARNKANGLINSTVSKNEINNEAFIRFYKLTFFDGNWTVSRQLDVINKIPRITITRFRKGSNYKEIRVTDFVFAPAYRFSYDKVPTTAIADFGDNEVFQCDGVVLYSNALGIHGFKFYYTDSAVTTVKGIQWNQKSNGSYAPVLEIDTVVLDDKEINRVSANGVPNLIDMEMGKGAKVRVILANTTIPKVIEVLNPSTDFEFPKCKCGYQMGPDDIYGSTLKCGNMESCIDKVNKWLPECAQWILDEEKFKNCKSLNECLKIDPKYIGWFLHVDRWDPDKKYSHSTESELGNDWNNLCSSLENDDFDLFKGTIDEMFIFSDLQYSNMEINIASAFEVSKKLYNNVISDYNKFIDE